MLDDIYLVYGLNALSRAHETNYFTDGHRGAAIISAYYLSREVEMEDGAADVIRAMIDQHWISSPLCAPLPEEPSEPSLVGRIAESVRRNRDGLRQAGHNVIFPSLALKAFGQVPEAVTSKRVAGICRLIESFAVADELRLAGEDNIADLGEPPEAATFILSELPRAMAAFIGRGQGWSGHLLTYGRALVDLHQSGYSGLAREVEQAFKIYIKRIRMGPLASDGHWPEHEPSDDRPHLRSYWERRRSRPIKLGHVFKYAYGYCGLMALAEDPEARRAARAVAHRVL